VDEGAVQQAAMGAARVSVEVTWFAYGAFAIAFGCVHLSLVLLIIKFHFSGHDGIKCWVGGPSSPLLLVPLQAVS